MGRTAGRARLQAHGAIRQTCSRWRRAGGWLLLDVGTDDPSGCTLAVTIEPSSNGSIRVRAETAGAPTDGSGEVTTMAAAFSSGADEHFLGFGERENAVDQAGKTVESWCVEGAFNAADLPFVPFATPQWAISGREDATYFPMPWSVSSRGYGFLLENTERSVFRLRTDRDDAWSVTADAPHLEYRVFAGPRPLDVVRRFSAALGRQPAPAAPWVLGPWWQPTGPDRATLPARFRDEDVPGSVIQTYTHYLPGGSQQGRREQEAAMVSGLHDAGYAVTTYFNPMVSVFYSPVFWDAALEGSLLRCVWGLPFVFRYNTFLVAQVDFTSESGRALYSRLLSEAVEDGHDGWMEDFGEYTPPLSVASDGTRALALHNRYPVEYRPRLLAVPVNRCEAHRDLRTLRLHGLGSLQPGGMGRRPDHRLGLRRNHGSGATGPDPGRFGGGLLRLGYRGVLLGDSTPHDTGTAHTAGWSSGAFSGVMRTESKGWDRCRGGSGSARSVRRSGMRTFFRAWRRYAKLRTQMYPYLEAAAREYVRTRGAVDG